MEVHHRDATQATGALTTVADSLPGLGIVAAVLGVVITMGALGGPPEEIGHRVAAALVGTFLGILLCYGFVGPIASNMTKSAEEEHAFLYVMRVLIVPFLKGTAQGHCPHYGDRGGPPRGSRTCAAFFQRNGASLPGWRYSACCGGRYSGILM
jgi:flagellar motor component MotA